jgi:hypothetical protein
MTPRHSAAVLRLAAPLLALAAAACTTMPPPPPDPAQATVATRGSVLRAAALDRATEDRILALDPERISAADVRDTLAKAPAPQVMLLHGGVYPVHLVMESFGEFLAGMGYPRSRIGDPGETALTRSPYARPDEQAGMLAWYYEREGVRPVVIGHSQGGIQAVKLLHTLAGAFDPTLRPFDPYRRVFEERTTIVDPLTGAERPVVGVSVAYASVVGTGGWSLALPNHWGIISRVRTIPDTVDEFVGYRIGVDLFALDLPGLENLKTFHAEGKAQVRNPELPASYSHVMVPRTAPLAEDPAMRAWIDAYVPGDPARLAPLPPGDATNVMWAADVWHDLKRHWAIEAQRFVRARRSALGQT